MAVKKSLKKKYKRPKLDFDFVFDLQRQKLLKSLGVDHQCLLGKRNTFDVVDTLTRIKPQLNYNDVRMRRSISIKKQVQDLDTLMSGVIRGSPVIGISSFPTDLRAKLLACCIMNKVIDKFVTNKGHITQYGLPLWHKVYGGFKDDLRDDGVNTKPSLLILTNVLVNSTNMKIEKLRDILEKYDDIPRIVVISGNRSIEADISKYPVGSIPCAGVDPITFFATKLQYPLNHGFYLGMTRSIEEDADAVTLDI